jgi:glycerate kinase
MKVLLAPDKFKGSLTAAQVVDHLGRGLTERGVEHRRLPLADGGDGSVAAAVDSGYRAVPVTVAGPTGRPHDAVIAFDGTNAVIEVANTCGLALTGGALAPLEASSRGFGEAIDHGSWPTRQARARPAGSASPACCSAGRWSRAPTTSSTCSTSRAPSEAVTWSSPARAEWTARPRKESSRRRRAQKR